MDNFINQTEDDVTKEKKQKLIRNILIVSLICIFIFGGIYLFFKLRKTGTDDGSVITFPTGKDIIGIITGENEPEVIKEDTVLSDTARLVELYKGPVAGYTLLKDSKIARVFDRAKGLIVDVDLSNGESKAVSDQPLLKVHDVTFIGENAIITRSLESSNTIKSILYFFNYDEASKMLTQSEQPSFLADDILELSKSQNDKYVVFVIKDKNGSNIDFFDVETRKLRRLISLPISEWIPTVSNNGNVFISSKASKYANSGTYQIVNGILNTVSPMLTAQTTNISPDGLLALSISIYDNEPIPEIQNTNPNSIVQYKSEVPKIEVKTIADKCSWNRLSTFIFCGSPKELGNNTPDDWYLGKIKYTDILWQYNLKTGESIRLIDLEKLDAISLIPNGNILFFKNKSDEHLWGYRLDEDVDVIKESESSTSTVSEIIPEEETVLNTENE